MSEEAARVKKVFERMRQLEAAGYPTGEAYRIAVTEAYDRICNEEARDAPKDIRRRG